jgi:hypothetical protein
MSKSWKTATTAAIIMVLLAMGGVALSTARSASAQTYWIILVPIYGVLCMATAWARTRNNPQARRPGLIRQFFHWLAIAAALGVDFLIRSSGEETAAAAGQNAVLLLALGCFLAGVHLEWLFALVGVLLTLALIVIVQANQYMWLIFLVGVFTIVAIFGVQWLFAKARRGRKETSAAPTSVPS